MEADGRRAPRPGGLGGHDARFPGRRVFPYKFLLLHYPARSQEQGERKVFRDRQGCRNAEERLAPGGEFDRRYLVERLSGIGIVR